MAWAHGLPVCDDEFSHVFHHLFSTTTPSPNTLPTSSTANLCSKLNSEARSVEWLYLRNCSDWSKLRRQTLKFSSFPLLAGLRKHSLKTRRWVQSSPSAGDRPPSRLTPGPAPLPEHLWLVQRAGIKCADQMPAEALCLFRDSLGTLFDMILVGKVITTFTITKCALKDSAGDIWGKWCRRCLRQGTVF